MSIKFQEFLKEYMNKETQEDKENLIKEYIHHKYIPYEKKVTMAKAIADNSYWSEETMPDGTTEKILHVDSTAKYMMVGIAIVKLFTDIDLQSDNGTMLDDYNILNEFGIMNLIIQNVDDYDLREFKMILEMVCDDIITNEYENHAYITKQIYRFGNLIGTALAPVVGNLDADRIEEFIKKINIKNNDGVA